MCLFMPFGATPLLTTLATPREQCPIQKFTAVYLLDCLMVQAWPNRGTLLWDGQARPAVPLRSQILIPPRLILLFMPFGSPQLPVPLPITLTAGREQRPRYKLTTALPWHCTPV